MPRDTPDWGATTGGGPVFLLEDLAELAVRLGSPVSYDRRGDVILYEPFNADPARWLTQSSIEAGDVTLSLATWRSPPFSGLYKTGGVTGAQVGLAVIAPYLILGTFGCEWSFTVPLADGIITTGVAVFDGTNLIEGQVRWNGNTDTVEYLDSAGAPVTVLSGIDLVILGGGNLFHTMKLVIDAENRKYVRALLNERILNLSAFDLYVAADSTLPHIRGITLAESTPLPSLTVYGDDIILTQNEPI